ncbi:MAG: glycosyltransferase [Methylophilaceae bacterium]|nr:glycosyltransferase [Methylophilaceae bacterium]
MTAINTPSPLRVSVVIPSYNAARFLPEAIDSVRKQTLAVHEIIIMDDGSTDDTEQVVQSLGDGILYIRQKNAGVSAARNRGIDAATGEIIAFLDADDVWLPEKIERQLQVFQDHPDVALVATDKAEIDTQGKLLLPSLFKQQHLHTYFSSLNNAPIPKVMSQLVKVNFIPTSSVLVRKAALNRVGVFDTTIRYGEDLELWVRIAAQFQIACLAKVMLHYRRHDTNATQATEKLLLDMVRVMKSIRSWGAAKLNKDGMDADKVVAATLWDLGYWYFSSSAPKRAYPVFMESLKESFSIRTLAYAGLSLIPLSVLSGLRKFKQKIRP